MTRSAVTLRSLMPDECIRTATSLFECMHASPTLENSERLAHWLGTDPRHVRALEIALTQWGLAQSGHPVAPAHDA
jgi:hypothetical protein